MCATHAATFHGRFAADLARSSPKKPTRARGSYGATRCSPPARCCACAWPPPVPPPVPPGGGLCQDGTGRMPQGTWHRAHGTGRMAQGGTPLMRSARGAHLPRHTPRSTCVVRHAPLSTLSPPTMRPAPRHRTTCGDVDGPVTAVSSNDATKPPPPASNGPVAALPVAALPAAAVPLAAAPLAAASCASCGSLQQVRRRGARADAVLLPA